MPIAIFYHCLFALDGEICLKALDVVHEQMSQLKAVGLEEAAEEIHVGVNGDGESQFFRALLPDKAQVTYHGLESKSENLTCLMLEKWAKTHPGWQVLYFHAKGATHPKGSPMELHRDLWRRRMMYHCVGNWQQCVHDLKYYDACGCHWRSGWLDGTQHYFSGNFFWVRSEFWATIPSIYNRARIQMSGIDSFESRFEAEVIIGNGPRVPHVRCYYDGDIGT
jgi:hypothetical protein